MPVKDYSTNANNNGSKPGINFAEGQVPSSLNDSARVVMADIAEWYAQISAGTVSGTVGGTGNAITLTTTPTVGAYATNQRYLVKAPGGNTVNNPTLNVSGLGVRTIVGPGGAALAIPSYQVDDMLLLAYDGTSFRLMSPASLAPATVAEVLTGTEATKMVTPDALAGLWQRGADIASASTLTLPTTGGGTFNVTGTTTVTGISAAQGGRSVKLRFAGSITLTHNATTFILPGAANIQTSAGDVAEFINDAAQDATGSNWRCVNFQFANGAPLQTSAPNSQTATYTATDADRGKLVRFSGLSADVTLNLPAAAGRAGFVLYVVNDDTNDTVGYGVIVDPSGSETIDGLTTRKGAQGSRVTLLCDGTGWRTVSGTWRYFSGNQTYSASTSYTLAHGLGVRPRRVWGDLRCTTADLGYAVGDTLVMPLVGDNSGSNGNGTVWSDATNVYLVMAGGFWQIHKTAFGLGGLTATSWRFRLWAED